MQCVLVEIKGPYGEHKVKMNCIHIRNKARLLSIKVRDIGPNPPDTANRNDKLVS